MAGLGGPDVILGQDGDDELIGMGGRDRIIGGDGDDTLVGGIALAALGVAVGRAVA